LRAFLELPKYKVKKLTLSEGCDENEKKKTLYTRTNQQ